jgi:hypothetical protein
VSDSTVALATGDAVFNLAFLLICIYLLVFPRGFANAIKEGQSSLLRIRFDEGKLRLTVFIIRVVSVFGILLAISGLFASR